MSEMQLRMGNKEGNAKELPTVQDAAGYSQAG